MEGDGKGKMPDIAEGIGQKPTIHEVVLTRDIVTDICEKIFAVMLEELPKEAHSISTFDYILSESKDMIHSKPVKLQ